MTDSTQPPAETLELIAELAPLVTKASHPNGWEWMFPLRVVPVDGKPTIVSHKGGNLFRGYIATWDEADLLVALANAAPRILAALTGRAGGDAIPAGMKPWHGGDAAPADWDGGPVFTYDDSEGGSYELQPPRFGEGDECWQRHNNFVDIIAYTPKPPAGGDAGALRWRERWYGSDPQRGSAIVDEAGNLIAYFGGDEETHRATTAVVAAHNAALATSKPSIGGDHG